MGRSRKDRNGGHVTRELEYKHGIVVWSQTGRNFAKRFRSKMMRRHSRESIRFMVEEYHQDIWEEYQEILDDYDYYNDTYEDDWHGYLLDMEEQEESDYCDPYDPYDYCDPYYPDDFAPYERYAETDYERGFRDGFKAAGGY
jgi:hypothetical protein